MEMESPYRINQHVLPRLLNIQNVSVVHFMPFLTNPDPAVKQETFHLAVSK
jgi:hypothetical protein